VEEGCRAFLETVDGIYGVYLDATTGFNFLYQRMVEAQGDLARRDGISPEEAESRPMAYDDVEADNRKGLDAPMLHKTTLGELKLRNEEGNNNWIFLANVCLVSIYQYWQDHFREEIATALDHAKKEDLQVPIMGDIRHYRTSIIHHGGIALPEMQRCHVLPWFRPGERIELTGDQMRMTVSRIRREISEIAEQSNR
jgi:hypothetical protein